jgi:AraC-like DNA-binding protein
MICSTLLEYLVYRIADIRGTEINAPSKAFLTYKNCRQQIKKNFITLNSLQDIAEACVIDPAYLCRLFKRFDTQSPHQYLLNLKMTYAADRFQESGILVKEIAHELGFNDPFHFTRIFKKVFGISPQSFKGLR